MSKVLELSEASNYVWMVIDEWSMSPADTAIMINGSAAEQASTAAKYANKPRLLACSSAEISAANAKLATVYTGSVNQIVCANFTIQDNDSISQGIVNYNDGGFEHKQIRL